MGYMRHHAIIVTAYDDYIKNAHAKAIEIFGAPRVSGFTDPVVNDYQTFIVGPDGSKEGWEPSMAGDEKRETFVNWLRKQIHSDGSSSLKWVEVQYGDDEGVTKVVNDSDSEFMAFQKEHPEEA